MKTKNIIGNIMTISGIIIFLALVYLIITGSSWPFTTQKTRYYGPYACENMNLVVRVNETNDRMKGEKKQSIDLLKNGEKIDLENYNPEGITYMRGLHWEGKCEPIVTRETPQSIDVIANCLDNVIESGKLTGINLCGIARFNMESE